MHSGSFSSIAPGMEEKMEPSVTYGRQRVTQLISVPYTWEEKPGVPKKEWSSKPVSSISFPSPARLVVSVPFQWEEKPGKPFAELPQSSPGSDLTPNESGFLHLLPLSIHPSNTWSIPNDSIQTAGKNPFLDDDDDDLDHGLDLEAFTFQITPGWSPFLRATSNTSQESSSNGSSKQQESSSSVLERDQNSSTNSSSKSNSVDSSALEFRFPLFLPDAGFLKKLSGQDRTTTATCPELLSKNSYRSSESLAVKRTMTLEELILLSRKLSYRLQPIAETKPRLSMEFIRKSLLACFPFICSEHKVNGFISSA